jgi:hypothetical protein
MYSDNPSNIQCALGSIIFSSRDAALKVNNLVCQKLIASDCVYHQLNSFSEGRVRAYQNLVL